MSINLKYSSMLIDKIRQAKEISYYELRNYFNEKVKNIDNNEINKFNEELDKLEEVGVIRVEEGMIIYVD